MRMYRDLARVTYPMVFPSDGDVDRIRGDVSKLDRQVYAIETRVGYVERRQDIHEKQSALDRTADLRRLEKVEDAVASLPRWAAGILLGVVGTLGLIIFQMLREGA